MVSLLTSCTVSFQIACLPPYCPQDPCPDSNLCGEPLLVVCDLGTKRSRLQMFSLDGQFERELPLLDVNIVAGLTTTQDCRILLVDSCNSTLFMYTPCGLLMNSFRLGGGGPQLALVEASELAAHKDMVFVCDFKVRIGCAFLNLVLNSIPLFSRQGHAVFVHRIDGQFLTKLDHPEYIRYPNGICLTPLGGLVVANSDMLRMGACVLNARGEVIGYAKCDTFAVSKLTGVGLTRDGLLVALARGRSEIIVMKIGDNRV